MAERNILTVGYEIPGFSDRYLSFSSDRSLLDADVILFMPTLNDFYSATYYQGKRRIADDHSPKAVEHCRRWKQELSEAVKAGKTVIVFLSPLEEVYVHLGATQVSGTGRSQKVTRIVESLTNYSALPFDLGTIVPKGGSEIRPAGDLKQLAPYWSAFGAHSSYKVYLRQPSGSPMLTAKAPDAIVGVMFKMGKGTALALPPVDYDEEKFTTENKKGELNWTKEALAFGGQLLGALVELDRALCADAEITPAPDWVGRPEFAVQAEEGYEAAAVAIDAEIERLRAERDQLRSKAAQAASLRDLLYESGKPLEAAVLRALRAMRFTATPFAEGESEFDAVFSSPEGRFIGEAEGKNDKAISVEKLDQLERNIREDFARQAGGAYAKGVLFGNAYRLRDLAKRPDFFTKKCYAAAVRGKVGLVRTPDLFSITHYLEQSNDEAFATACRKAILEAEGVVVKFPPLSSGDTAV
jgi:hypothetical protein